MKSNKTTYKFVMFFFKTIFGLAKIVDEILKLIK